MISLLLNLLWVIFGGLPMALGWLLTAVVMAITIIGLPWARAALTIAVYSLWPFGQTLVNRRDITGQDDIGTGGFGLIGNIIWFVLAGWWLAIGHLCWAVAWAVTIIGLPFAWAHLKLAAASIAPIGKMVVPGDIGLRR